MWSYISHFLEVSIAVVPVASFLFTLRYQYITNQISSIRNNRDSVSNYGNEIIITLYKYYRARARYLDELRKMIEDKRDKKTITDRRSEFVYGLKDDYIQLEIDLESIKQKITLELPDIIFPGVKSPLLSHIEEIQKLVNDTDSHYSREKLDNFNLQCNNELNQIKKIFTKIVDEETQELIYYSNMSLLRVKSNQGLKIGVIKYIKEFVRNILKR